MPNLILAAIAFIAIHIGISGTRMRDRLVAGTGLNTYMVLFSLLSVFAIIWLVGAYKSAAYVPTWGMLQWWKPVAIVLMLPAFLLVVIGLTTPNPTAVAQEGLVDRPPAGIVRVTRHPFLVGVGLWSAIHLVGNGDQASFVLFAAMLIVSVAGPFSIDAKRARSLGTVAWAGFAARTSILPFAAIAAGRNTLSLREIGWWRPLAGVVAYAVMLGGHAHIVGVSPWP